jgi:hypothetical protein
VGGGVLSHPFTQDESSTRLGLNGRKPTARQPARITRSDRPFLALCCII